MPRALHADQRDRPFATTTTVAGARRLVAVNASAVAAGVRASLPLADARAMVPVLTVAESDPAADARALRRLSRWCERWTPWVAVEDLREDGGAGLWLDVTGCDHLFGGEAALVDTIRTRLDGLGLTARLGLADTPGAAWAAARCLEGEQARLPPGSQRQLLGGLPLAALRLPPATREVLARLGLRTIADLLARPRAPLTRRLGPELWRRLDQLLGEAPEPLSPQRPVVAYRTRLDFADPIGRTEDVSTALDHLLAALCRMMERDGRGLRRVELRVFRVDGSTARAVVGTGRPGRDPAHLARLFHDRLEGLDAGFGIEAMTLAALTHQPLTPGQRTLMPDSETPAGRDSLPRLIDRLAERCGPDAVVRLAPVPSHRPERAQRPVAPDAPDAAEAAGGYPPHQAPRPVRLLRQPRRVAPPAGADGLSVERIGGEWWRGPAGGETVDLLRVEAADGARTWVARDRAGWTARGVFA
ncbi:protein ImuB [Rhodospira trueperi]|uniref:Protein ImuB n=2 Tax=Rhodospira trueperi TaxID=69960 RepID=A0A1G7HMP2_9PROT|nr:protein ImuB [Rhodospira trueperi]